VRSRVLRLLLTLSTLLVVWLVTGTGTASAASQAPQCDPRGATTFAPPPQLQEPDSSLDIVVNDDDCTKSPLETRQAVPKRAPPIDAAPSARDAAVTTIALPAVHVRGERLPAPGASEVCLRPGFRTSVDRPPRA
jgi:hypothetical protein